MTANLSPVAELEVKVGDVLLSRKNTYEHVAACVFVAATRQKLMLPDLIFRLVLSRSSGLLPEVLWGTLSDRRKRRQVQGLAGGTAGSMPNISKERLRDVELPVPPVGLQRKFAKILSDTERLRGEFEKAAGQADTLFNSLVARTFSTEATC
jgi:type I restriction enzyme S subunit